MNESCGSCKYARYDKTYLYPFKCLKDRANRYSGDVLTERIAYGYKCDKYEFGFENKKTDVTLLERVKDVL